MVRRQTGAVKFPKTPGGLNRSMQHRLGVYSQEFESPRFFSGVDLSAVLLCRDRIESSRTMYGPPQDCKEKGLGDRQVFGNVFGL
jgi:hypothetical protein